VDPDWEPLSAGFLVNLASLRRALGDPEISEYDWMRGMEAYKLQMSTDVVATQNLVACSSPLLAGALGTPAVLRARVRPVVERNPTLERAWSAARRLRDGGYRPMRSGLSETSRWALVTDAGGAQARSAVAAVRALAAAGYVPAVATSGSYSLAAASRYCRRRVTVPPAGASGFADALREEFDAGPYVALLPSSDAALLAMGSDIEPWVDKEVMAERARSADLPTPPSIVFESPEELQGCADQLDYPVVVKPKARRDSSPRPAFLAPSRAHLDPRDGWGGPVLVQPYLEDEVHAVCGVVWEGRMVAAVHQRYLRTWPADCGTSSAAVTTAPDPGVEERLLKLLEGYHGIFQAQFAGPYLLDLNPRVYGSLPLAVRAGANLVAVYCDLVRDKPVLPLRGRPDVFYRWLEGDLRSLRVAVRQGRLPVVGAARELRPRRGAAHSTESLRDPGPMFLRAAYVLGRRVKPSHP
jgi:hypothetical protein